MIHEVIEDDEDEDIEIPGEEQVQPDIYQGNAGSSPDLIDEGDLDEAGAPIHRYDDAEG